MSDDPNIDPNIDPETGLEIFFYRGQKRYKCPTLWESGARCQMDHYDPAYVLEHSRTPHTASGKAKPVKLVQQKTSSLVDSRGTPMTYDVPDDLKDVHFRK